MENIDDKLKEREQAELNDFEVLNKWGQCGGFNFCAWQELVTLSERKSLQTEVKHLYRKRFVELNTFVEEITVN